jgi:O-antigen/teichoic acid export membrane protein
VRAGKSARDAAGIFGTRVVWAAMGMVSGVILARWLGPYDRGILALALLVPSTVLTLVKLGVAQATIYFINRKEASVDRVASNSVVLALLLGAVSAAGVWLLRDTLLHRLLNDVPDWALALALARVPMLLLDNYLFSILQATGQFGVYNSRLLISEALRLVVVGVTVMGLGLGLPAAVATYTLIGLVNIVWLMLAMSRTIHFSLAFDGSLLSRMLSFGVRSYVQTVTSHLLLRVDVYMVQYFLGPEQTAFYALALHFTELVLEVPQAIGMVLYPRLASLPKEEIHRLTAQTCRRTLVVTAPAALLLGVVGPYLVTLWYGTPYAPAGLPLPWAAVGVTMMSIFVIITRDFTARSSQRINTVSGLLALGVNVGLNIFLIPRYGIVGAAFATAVGYSAACIVLIVFWVRESELPCTSLLLPTREDVHYFWSVGRQYLSRLRPARA